MHSTNYFNTLIEIAEDSRAQIGQIPPTTKGTPSVARLQFEMLHDQPYKYTSDDVLFTVFAIRNNIPESEREEQRGIYFAKGRPCFRASPLTKRYGWGIHSNCEGKIALYSANSQEYQKLIADETVKKKKAMRSKRK